MEPKSPRPAPECRTAWRLWRLVPLAVPVFMQISWLENLIFAPDRAVVRRDWYKFYETAHLFVSGQWSAIYPQEVKSGYFWFYPPYCIYLTAPLALLPEWYAYALCALVEVVAVAAAFAVLRAAVPGRSDDHVDAAIVALASMPFNTTLAIGQISGVVTLLLAAALWAWRRARPLTTGLLLALLFIKPNLAVFFPPLLLIGRQWHVLVGMAVGGALLLLSSVPLGLARWHEYRVTAHGLLELLQHGMPLWKHLTLYAFWASLAGIPDSLTTPVGVAWSGSVALVAAAAALAWWRRSTSARALPRLFGITVLLAISANMYVYFYDGLLLLVPGLVWHVRRADYVSLWRHRLIGLCILLIFLVGYGSIFFVLQGTSFSGPLIAIWLLCEASDLLATPLAAASGSAAS